jgi:hypothetical protein
MAVVIPPGLKEYDKAPNSCNGKKANAQTGHPCGCDDAGLNEA